MLRIVVLACLLVLPRVAAYAEDAATAFPKFCEEWMEKLQEREKRNQGMIKWDEKPDAVSGSYVGYSHQHTCVLKAETGPAPIGKITYLEVRYEKRGSSKEEAASSAAKPVETTEVTEIFRFAKGAWVY